MFRKSSIYTYKTQHQFKFLLRSLSFLILFFVIWLTYAQAAYAKVKYTWFFRVSDYQANQATQYSNLFERSKRFLETLSRQNQMVPTPSLPLLSIIILTSPRIVPYFPICLSSLLNSLSPSERLLAPISVFDATPVDQTPSQELQLLRSINLPYFRVINGTELVENNYRELNLDKNTLDWTQTQLVAYLSALKFAQRQNSKFSLILEDDVLSTRFLMPKLRKIIETIENEKFAYKNYAFVRLFLSDHWSGWENHDAPILVLTSLVLAIPLTLLLILLELKFSRYTKFTPWILCPVYTVAFGIILFILLSLNKQNLPIVSLSRSFKVYPIGKAAGALAMLFRNDRLENLIVEFEKYGRAKSKIEVDNALNEYSEFIGAHSLHAVPDLFQHMGAHSSAWYKNQGNYQVMKTSGTFEDPADRF